MNFDLFAGNQVNYFNEKRWITKTNGFFLDFLKIIA